MNMEPAPAPSSVSSQAPASEIALTVEQPAVTADKTASPHSSSSSARSSSSSNDHVSKEKIREASPAISVTSSLTSISATPPPPAIHTSNATTQGESGFTAPPPAKRRKLTPAEKEQRQAQKDQKQRERADQKVKREEIKQAKDEERRQKNEVKEEKKREKDFEKQRKEDEKRRLEEEKEKKERAQSRINVFFAKPKTPVKRAERDTLCKSTEAVDSPVILGEKSEPLMKSPSLVKSDYQRSFLSFSVSSNTTCAPESKFDWDEGAIQHCQNVVDKALSDPRDEILPDKDLRTRLNHPGGPRRHIRKRRPLKDIVSCLVGSENSPVDLTTEAGGPLEMLQQVPLKYILFSEDVRPPYFGTYTKITSPTHMLRFSRNPFKRFRNDTDYDYDSEAEWEEPEEGEDIESEAESEAESNEDGEDLEGFLDDEDDQGQPKRKPFFSGDLEPVSSGLCWQRNDGSFEAPDGKASELLRLRIGVLNDSIRMPIDPFSTAYWSSEAPAREDLQESPLIASMQPPRQPLQAFTKSTMNNMKLGQPSSSTNSSKSRSSKQPSNPPRLLDGEQLEKFKTAVQGSEHTKIGLLALLKKQFPSVPKAVLSDTLGTVAARVGRTEAEKKWVIVS